MDQINKKTITIISVSYYSSWHLNRLFNNLIEKADHPSSIQFLVVDNSNNDDLGLKDSFREDLAIKIILNNGKGLQRSVSHASALDLGLKSSNTKFTLIIDPDVHVFKKAWDTLCIDQIIAQKQSVIGAPYPTWKLGKVHDYPSVIFIFFETDQVQNLGKRFFPFPGLLRMVWNSIFRKITRLGLLTSKSRLDRSKILRSVSGQLEKMIGITSPDTGKDIIESMRDKGFNSVMFDAPYSLDIKGKEAQSEMAKEFELFLLDDKPIMTHMYGSGVFHWKTEKGEDIDYWEKLISKIEEEL
tara:strand:- start:2902 stop:3798 length:897 start_codon:yes stop_codon:yes gene_type:complete